MKEYKSTGLVTNKDKFEELVMPYKVIRDPVHGDIWITKIEEDIIDTNVFQKLRRIKQLGPTYLVYPSANHTRFEHSIGTLYMAQRIAEAINKNFKLGYSDIPLLFEDIFITRIVALLHDLAHLSFGHTLEDEGALFKDKQWGNSQRRRALLDIINPKIKTCLRNNGIASVKTTEILKEIENILIAEEKGEEEIKKLERPFIADIVGNTICADLLDYLKRDGYFTGLQLTYDNRIVSYFIIKKYCEIPRVAILLERRHNVVRKDILSECINLLRLRYSLAEKVYYHRVKTIFSAMIIKMAYRAREARIVSLDELLRIGDEALLWKISQYVGNDEDALTAKTIAEDVMERTIYKDIYQKRFEEYTPAFGARINSYRDVKNRYALENFFKKTFSMHGIDGVSPAGFTVYIPKTDLGKAALTKMFIASFDPPVQTLIDLTEKEYTHKSQEISAINTSYKMLWQFYVLLKGEDYTKLVELGISDNLMRRVIDDVLMGRSDAVVEVRSILLEKKEGNPFAHDVKQEVIKTAGPLEPREGVIDNIDKSLLEKSKKGET